LHSIETFDRQQIAPPEIGEPGMMISQTLADPWYFQLCWR